jgi:hypothetical protein
MGLQKRYSGWYIRVAIPGDLRPILERNEYVRSLSTTSALEARARGHHAEARVSDVFAELRRQKGKMTTEQLRALANRYLYEKLDAAETMAARVIAEAPGNPDALEVRQDGLADLLEDAERRFATKGQQQELHRLADALIAEARLDVARDSMAYNLFWLWLYKAQQDAARAELRLTGRYGGPDGGTSPVDRGQGTLRPSVRVSEAIDRYVEFKRTQGAWTAKTDQLQTAVYADLVALLGDKPASEISKADLLRYYGALPKRPSNAAKKWPGLDARQILEATEAMDVPRLAVRSVNKRLGMVRSLFAWMTLTDIIEREASEVLKDLPEGDAAEARIPFSDGEALAFVAACEAEATNTAQRLVPRILAYSGLSLDEAAQLTRSDVTQVDSVWCLHVNADEGK